MRLPAAPPLGSPLPLPLTLSYIDPWSLAATLDPLQKPRAATPDHAPDEYDEPPPADGPHRQQNQKPIFS